MTVTDPISNMLASIRNAQNANIIETNVPYSKVKENILTVFAEEGFIENFKVVGEGVEKHLAITLKYSEFGGAIRELKRISKPGLRKYSNVEDLPYFHNGLGVYVLSTSKGVIADHKARELKVGGEIICNIY